MPNYIDLLKQLGLSEKEARVYLMALELGPTTIIKLAQKCKIKRSTIYEFLDSLVERGVLEVSILGKRKLYNGAEPQKLKNMVKRQEVIIDTLIPELSMLANRGVEKPKMMFYEGVEGLKMIYNDTITQGGEYELLYYASLKDLVGNLSEMFLKNYIIRRAKRGVKARGILPSDETTAKLYSVDSNKKELRETMLVPRNELPIHNETLIYKNRMAIMSFGDQKLGVIIESQEIADTHRAIFNLLWKSLKKNK